MTDLRRFCAIFALLLGVAAAAPRSALVITEIPSPAGGNSQTPYLSSSETSAYLSWQQEVNPGSVDLFYSTWNGTQWSPPGCIVTGAPLYRNWADFPSIVPLGEGSLAAHWLQRSGEGTYAYDVMFSVSRDGGKTWSAGVKPHHDNVKNEHGFVSLIPQERAGALAVWLDSRNFKPHGEGHEADNEMQLMAGVFGGKDFEPEVVVDPRVCDCCQTTAVAVPGGVFVAYRDRSESEIRDISFVRLVDGKWSSPESLHEDGWLITGCPVNGPAAAALQNRVVVAWFTAAKDKPVVVAAFSTDGGKTFKKPIRVDHGNPKGRVDVDFLPDGSSVVSWLENTDIQVRRIGADGTAWPSQIVASATAARAGGFPRMTRWQDSILLAWTDVAAEAPRIRIAQIKLK